MPFYTQNRMNWNLGQIYLRSKWCRLSIHTTLGKNYFNWFLCKTTCIFQKHLHSLGAPGKAQIPWSEFWNRCQRHVKVRGWVRAWGWGRLVLTPNFLSLQSDFEKIKFVVPSEWKSLWLLFKRMNSSYCGKIVSFAHERIAYEIRWLNTIERKRLWKKQETAWRCPGSLPCGGSSAMLQRGGTGVTGRCPCCPHQYIVFKRRSLTLE